MLEREEERMGGRSVGRTWTRRDFLRVGGGALVGAYALGTTGCGGGSNGSGSGELTVLTWGSTSGEEKGFRELAERYNAQNPEVPVKMEFVPADQAYEQLDTRLAAGEAPDIARLQYQQMGKYASEGALADLSEYLDDGYGDAFTPALWQAVNYEGAPYGMPQHTDTFAVFYNTDIFEKVGIEAPRSMEESWTWDEFLEIATGIKDEGAADFAFAYNWQGTGASYRWMPLLFQHGGQLLDSDLAAPAIESPAGIETVAFTKRWFDEGLVPPSTSIKSGEQIETLFSNGTTAMMLSGDWLIPFVVDNMKAGWDVTYMIRDEAMASDLGGNALAVTRDSPNPEAAADFLKFAGSDENMSRFCIIGGFIPTRTSLAEQGLDYTQSPEQMNRFVKQATTVPEKMALEQTIPAFGDIVQVLTDQLEAAFKTGQSPEQTVRNIASGIQENLES
jgi:multiple sugar transport system substrate-binding protein